METFSDLYEHLKKTGKWMVLDPISAGKIHWIAMAAGELHKFEINQVGREKYSVRVLPEFLNGNSVPKAIQP